MLRHRGNNCNTFCGSPGKESTSNADDLGSNPGLGRSPGEGKGYPLQYSGLENSMDCIDHGVTKSWTLLSDFHFIILFDPVLNPWQESAQATFLSSLFSLYPPLPCLLDSYILDQYPPTLINPGPGTKQPWTDSTF